MHKQNQVTRLFLMAFAIILITGCTTLADSVADKGKGEKRIYDKPLEELWPITVEAVTEVGLDLVSTDTSQIMILAQRGITAFSYGENVAIFLEDIGAGQCKVEVVSKRAMATNVIAPDWSRNIFSYLNKKLNTKGKKVENGKEAN